MSKRKKLSKKRRSVIEFNKNLSASTGVIEAEDILFKSKINDPMLRDNNEFVGKIKTNLQD